MNLKLERLCVSHIQYLSIDDQYNVMKDCVKLTLEKNIDLTYAKCQASYLYEKSFRENEEYNIVDLIMVMKNQEKEKV